MAAQQPVRADSAARADSLRLLRELRGVTGDTAQPRPGPRPAPPNPRLLPDLSVVGDLIADFSRGGSTQEDGGRFSVREVELALQAAVDPYFRGEVFLGFNDVEGVSVEQAFVTATALPWRLEARGGRFLMPVGKQNTTHRHDLHTVEYPWVLQRFLGAEGLKGTGVTASRIFAPFGFYQEVIVSVVDRFGESEEGLVTGEPVNRKLSGLGYAVRARNYWDLSEASNLEASASVITGRKAQPLAFPFGGVTAVPARQTVWGVDVTYRWRPLARGLYRSFILQGEFQHQVNHGSIPLPVGATPEQYLGPTRGHSGAYLFGRLQVGRRTYVGSRVDWVQDPEREGRALRAASGVLQFFPSEFSKLMASIERTAPRGEGGITRLLFQVTFALGPHRPHPF